MYLSNQHHIEALVKALRKIRVRRAMLEASAPPELRDHELRRRLAKTETEQAVTLELLAQLGVYPEETIGVPAD